MAVFKQLFMFMSWLLTINVTVGGYNFSLAGAIGFAIFILVFFSFIRFLFQMGD